MLHCPRLAISIAAAWLATAVSASAQDSAKAPCETIAQQLRALADRPGDPVVDTGRWEFLRAAGLKDAENASSGLVSTIPEQQFNTVEAALESLAELSSETVRRELDGELGFMAGTPTYIHDFRPASDHLIISQSQGTMNCDTGVMYRIASGRFEPVGTIGGEPGEMCWTRHMTAFKVGASAYAAIESITDEPGVLHYDLSLMPPEPVAINPQAAACRVAIKFAPTTYLRESSTAPGITEPWVAELLAKLGPFVIDSQDLGAALQPMTPKPDGNSAYDDFLRADPEEAHYYLGNLDPNNVLGELPETQNGSNYGSASDMTAYALVFEGHRLILKFGQANFGWKVSSDNAFGIWEWKGGKVIPIASGDLAKRATHPEITVQ